MGNKMRGFALILGIIILGSVSPDFDHILPPYDRSWGHDWRLPTFILSGVVIAYLGRRFRDWILDSRL